MDPRKLRNFKHSNSTQGVIFGTVISTVITAVVLKRFFDWKIKPLDLFYSISATSLCIDTAFGLIYKGWTWWKLAGGECKKNRPSLFGMSFLSGESQASSEGT